MNFNDVAIVSVKGSDYRIHFWYKSTNHVINIMNNATLNEKKLCYIFFLLCIKMSECNSIKCNSVEKTYYQKNRDVTPNRAKDYYKNNKERLRKQTRDKYRNLSEEEKNKKREYGKSRNHDMSDEMKQKLKKYQKNYRATKKLK